MRYAFTLISAVVIGLIVCGGLSEANASRLHYRPYASADWRYYGYPRPNCTSH